MKKYKVVVFDINVTLTSSQTISDAEKKLTDTLGTGALELLFDGGTIDTLPSVDVVIEMFKQKIPLSAEQETLVRNYIDCGDSVLTDDALPIIQYLRERGYRIALLSNSPPSTRNPLTNYGFEDLVECILFSFQVGHRKPERELFLALLEKLSVRPEETLMIGDSLKNDILGAQAVGMDAILLDRENRIDFAPKISNLLDLKKIL